MTSLKSSSPGRSLSLSKPSTPIPDLTDRITRQGNGQYCEAGGFGDVFRCTYTSNDGIKEVAVKAFRFGFFIDDVEHKCDGEKAARRIRRELEIWRRLSHRNIVPFLGITRGFGRDRSVSLVSIWMPQGTLHTFLQAHDGRLGVAHRLQLLLDVANGLHYLHSFQITHGDLSSTNVLLDNNYTACLADFGCASLIGELPEGLNYLKTSTVGQGTRRWAAPERFAFNEQKLTRTIKSDIYSFGSMALFILSGRLPWSEVSTDEAIIVCMFRGLNPGRPHQRPIDDRHWALIEWCWLPVPERPPAEDVIAFLQRFFGAYAPPPPLRDSLVPKSFRVPDGPGNDDPDDDVVRSRSESQESPTSFMPPPPKMTRRPSPHDVNAAKRNMSSDLPSPAILGNEPVDLSTFDMAPVKMPVNRWVAPIPIRKPGATGTESPELVDREVKALLNKLTMEKFDSISDQITAWANKSVNGWTLIQVIRLVFEKASNEAEWSEMYARLCQKMMETISPEVQDVGIQTSEGKPIAGGRLFRKYLLDRCRENFGRGWVAKETTVKASDDQAMKKKKRGDESKPYPDKYHAASGQKEKLGLIKFIGDLFKLQLLTESIMHQCIKRFLPNVGNPEEEEIENLCQLLKTAGQLLDVPKARAHMDMYFARMEELCKGPNVSPTVRSMLKNVIDLRSRKWVKVQAEEVQDTVASPPEDSVESEEGEIIENGEVVETQVNSDVLSKPPNAQKEALRIDMSSMPPPPKIPRRRPGPLDINAAKRDMSAAPLSALATARNIERLQDIEYPEGIRSPREDLNKDVKDGKFRYDRDFLMQFMQLCKEKPPNLPPLDILGIEPVDQSTFGMSCRGLGRHRQPSSAITPARQSSVGLGITGGFGAKPGAGPSPFAMGQFSTPTSKLTSEERFTMSSGTCSASVSSGPDALQFGRPPMAQTASQGGPGGHPMGSNRVRSRRGDKRTDANKVAPLEGPGFGVPGADPGFGVAFEPVAPLEISANHWVATSTVRKPGAADTEHPELVDRKVRSLLNKLTMEKLDSISDQIVFWANKSANENDGRTLIQVIRLVFEKATDEAAWSEMYARLCRKMMETISPDVQDDGIRNSDGKPIVGGQLFRKYLLNRCQEDFERSWVAKETTAAAAKAKALDDQAVKAANEKKGEESELYSEEYYAAQKAKRQGLGLIKFIGELFKLQMLTERIMHECVKKLLGNVENPEEEEIESLCQLLKTVGQLLDAPKARARMDVYFTRMKELCKSLDVSPRMQFMLQDVIDLRDRRWVARGAVIAPTTISPVHEAVRIWDASTSSSSNMFSMLSQNPELVVDTTAKPSRPPGRKPSVDLGQVGVPEPPLQRKKLQLFPRSKPIPAEETPPGTSEEEPDAPVEMSAADAKKKIDEDVKEFFAVRSMEEADVYFTNLPEEYRFLLVDKLVASALESKEADAVLVADFFTQAASEGQCSPEVLEAGFMPMAELLDDIAIDAPNAFKFMAIMLKGAGFDKDEERLARLAGKSMDNDKLLQLVSS